jgi:uncharacterized protein with HEPN domain
MQRHALYIADLVESTRTVRDYLEGVRREQWDEDRVLRDAVLYRLLLLGEIASALPDFLQEHYPDVAWRQIRAFRNLAVHKYFSVDWAVVWQIAQQGYRFWKGRRWTSCVQSSPIWQKPTSRIRRRPLRMRRGPAARIQPD